jgi:prepilin-type N-terminal cleavage/methylation domain-containing protein
MKNQKGFTLIELIVVIAIIAILAAVAVPAFISVVDQAHEANMDAVEGAFRSAVVMFASDNLLNNGSYVYPAAAVESAIALLIEDTLIPDWSDDGLGVWTYAPTGGTLTYTSVVTLPSSYTITKVYVTP